MISKKQEEEIIRGATIGLLAVLTIVVVINGYLIHGLTGMMTGNTKTVEVGEDTQMLGGVVPSGTPETYGEVLGVSYDDVSPTDQQRANRAIAKLANIDKQMTLEGEDLERYVNILYHMHGGISCEYCCGARSIIFENGEAACGCAHSYAMRGLAKYLITEHGAEYTDEEILTEVAKWKVLFFPTQSQNKVTALENEGVEANYVNLGSNRFRGIEEGRSGGMVGGC